MPLSDGDNPLHYHAFVLRCWQERSRQAAQPSPWRFSLQHTRAGAWQGFATLEAVLAAVEAALTCDTEPRPVSEQAAAESEEGGA